MKLAKNKKKKNHGFVKDPNMFYHEKHISKENIGDYNTVGMTIFGANVVLARHVPNIIDGLKPVERRIMYMMYMRKRNKSMMVSEAVAQTMLIHPHGDSSPYNALVRLGQEWQNVECAIDRMGENYGSADGVTSEPAAPRYIHAKLSKYAMDCFFKDFDTELVDTVLSYDEELKEPLMLPARYPNVLVNGANGMAFGVQTCIPNYNIRDLFSYTIKLMEDPDGDHGVIAPDSPTGCLIIDDNIAFKTLQHVGRSPDNTAVVYRMRADMDVDEDKHTITINSLPFGSSAEKLLLSIKELKESGLLAGCTKVANTSAEEVVEIKLSFKPEVDLFEIREQLYNMRYGTEKYFPGQITVIDDMSIKRYSVKEALLRWIDYRRDFKRRYYNMKIVRGKAREHILDIILFIYNKENSDITDDIIRKSEDRAEAISKLVKRYNITSIQAAAIADMKKHESTKKAIKGYREEREQVISDNEKYMKIVSAKGKIDKIIIEELVEGIKKYGTDRRSKLVKIGSKDHIANTNHTIVITKKGFIKKLREDTKSIGRIGAGDEPMEVLHVNNRDSMLIFDSKGKVHTLPVNTVRGCDLASNGVPLSTHARIDDGKIVAVFVMDSDTKLQLPSFGKTSEAYFLFTTKVGMVKKTAYSAYTNLKNSAVGINLKKDGSDELVSVKFINKDTDVVVFTYNGYGSRFNSDSITETKRMSMGVKTFDVGEHDAVCDTTILSKKDTHLMIVTMKGYVKKLLLSILTSENRRSDSSVLIKMDTGDLMMFAKGIDNTETYTAILCEDSFEFSPAVDVTEKYRLNKGTKLIPVKKGDKIIKLVKTPANK